MACDAFEDRLLDYGALPSHERLAVDEHLHGCDGCRTYLQRLEEIDAAMTSQLRRTQMTPGRLAEVRRVVTTTPPIPRVSRLPEWLDLLAVAAVFAFVSGLAWQIGLVAHIADVVLRSPAN